MDVLFRNIDEAALVCEVVEAVFVALRAIWSLSRVGGVIEYLSK